MSFYNWLIKQKHREDWIGDLARDAEFDNTFPVETQLIGELKKYLINCGACIEAIQALEWAMNEFKEKNRKRSQISLSLRFKIFRRDNYKCQICGSDAKNGARLEIDHKIPIVKGGNNNIENLWTLCFKCNRGKGVKNL